MKCSFSSTTRKKQKNILEAQYLSYLEIPENNLNLITQKFI